MKRDARDTIALQIFFAVVLTFVSGVGAFVILRCL